VTTVRIPLPAGTMAVPLARRFASDTLRSWRVSTRTVEIAELIVSELVGNAVEHGGGGADLDLSLADGVVRVGVLDRSPDLPVVLTPRPVEGRHRGLLIVAALSSRWGSSRFGSGKLVWAEVPAIRVDEPTSNSVDVDDRSMSG
jgi:anti-sigma regulatory factor (Ser/Thr protein kinase)